MNRLATLLLVIVLMTIISCKSTKMARTGTTADKITVKTINKSLSQSKLQYEWFSTKAKVVYEDAYQKQTFTANIRIKKDTILWMSLTGPFGIEGGRVLILSDTIHVLDRINKKYYVQPVGSLDQLVPFEGTFLDIEQILTGNPLDVALPKQKVQIDNNVYKVSGTLLGYFAHYFILPNWFRYQEVQMHDPIHERDIRITYDHYKEVNEQLFAMNRSIHYTDRQNEMYLQIDFGRIKINEPLAFPFQVSDKYEMIKQ